MKKLSIILIMLLAYSFANAQVKTLTLFQTNTEQNMFIPAFLDQMPMAYCHSQFIYPSSLLTAMKGTEIKKITFYRNKAQYPTTTPDMQVQVGMTSADNLSAGFVSTAGMTTVYTGKASVVKNTPVFTITFTTPFLYTGGNLLFDIHNISMSGGVAGEGNFYGLEGGDATGKGWHAWGASLNGTPMDEGLQDFLPRIQFEYEKPALKFTVGENSACDQYAGTATRNAPLVMTDIDWSYPYTQVLYNADLLTELKGTTIKKMTFYTTGSGENGSVSDVLVRLGQTTTANLENSFVTNATMTQVYRGPVKVNGNQMVIEFTQGFPYTGNNLLIEMAVQVMGEPSYDYFCAVPSPNMTRTVFPMSVPVGVPTTGWSEAGDLLPKVTFEYEIPKPTITLNAPSGSTQTSASAPFCFNGPSYNCATGQVLYPSMYLSNANLTGRKISKITFYRTVSSVGSYSNAKVSIGTTSTNSLTEIASIEGLTKVYEGPITTTNNDLIVIEFDEPFKYTGGNLLLDIRTLAGNVTSDANGSSLVAGTVYVNTVIRTGDASGTNCTSTNKVTGMLLLKTTFELEPQFKITPSAGTNGSISPNTATSYDEGATTATFTFTPNTGYVIDKVMVNGTTDVTPLSGNTYTFPAIDGDKTIHVTFKPIVYTITYNNTKTASNSLNPTSYTIATPTVSLANLELAGYMFDGWYDAETNGTKIEQITLGSTGNKILYGRWTANNNTIVFNGNGHTGGSMSNQIIATDATAALTTNGYTRTGYMFAGWATSTNGTVAYANGANYTMGTNASYTLYAKWTANNNTIVFNGNGSTGGSMSNQVIATDATAALTTNGYTRTGYTFAGWATSAEGAVVYANSANYTMGTNASYTLYAKWTANTYKVTFHKNHEDATGTMAEQAFTYGTAQALTSNGFSRTGYNFAGWATTPTGTREYTNAASYTIGAENVTLYAIWTANTYTVTFDKNNENATGTMLAQTFTYGVAQNLTANAFALTGYTFAGWTTTANGDVEYENEASFSIDAANTTLYAVWTANSYTVTFDKNNETATGTMSEQTFTYGVAQNLTANTFALTGYTFAGWATAANGDVEYENEASFSIDAANATLYAVWEVITDTIVYHNLNGLTNPNPATYTIEDLPLTLLALTGGERTFLGWCSDSALTTIISAIAVGTTGKVELWAKWESVGIPNHVMQNVKVYSYMNTVYIVNQDQVPLKSIEITDITGRVVYRSTSVQSPISLNVAEGQYMVRLMSHDGILNTKVVIR